MLEPLSLTVGDLEADMLPMPVRFGRRTNHIRLRDGALYFILPFSHRVWRFDTQSGDLSSIKLPNDSPDISEYARSTDSEAVGKVMSQLEAELDLWLLDDRIAVMSNYQRQWRMGLYSYAGELITKGQISRHVNFESGGQFFSLRETGSEPDLYEVIPVSPPEN